MVDGAKNAEKEIHRQTEKETLTDRQTPARHTTPDTERDTPTHTFNRNLFLCEEIYMVSRKPGNHSAFAPDIPNFTPQFNKMDSR